MKKRIKWIFAILILFLIYLIVGATVPFMFPKDVSNDYKDSINIDDFYKDSNCNDYASIIETNADALTIRLRMIEEARESIILSTFDIRQGKSTTDIFAALVAAADRGVDIKIIVDGAYGLLHMSGEDIFTAAGTHDNIEIRFYNTPNLLMPWTINGRLHDKYLIVDNSMVLMGGRNTFDYFIGEYTNKNISYDREVLIYNALYEDTNSNDSAVYQFLDYFDTVWNSRYSKTHFTLGGSHSDTIDAYDSLISHYNNNIASNSEYTSPIDFNTEMIPIENAVLVTNPTGIMKKEPYIFYTLSELMSNAHSRVLIHTPYIVLDDYMYDTLDLINDQVDNFSILVNSIAVGDNVMASSDYFWSRDSILDTGIDIYEFNGDYSSHGKSVLIDNDISVIGSFNYDMRSAYLDTETMLVIYSEELNSALSDNIDVMLDSSFKVDSTGEYMVNDSSETEPVELTSKELMLYKIAGTFFKLIRYLI